MKIKYTTARGGEYIEFPLTVTCLLLPNGNEFTIRFDEQSGGLVVNKAYSEDNSAMKIHPQVSNQIIIT